MGAWGCLSIFTYSVPTGMTKGRRKSYKGLFLQTVGRTSPRPWSVFSTHCLQLQRVEPESRPRRSPLGIPLGVFATPLGGEGRFSTVTPETPPWGRSERLSPTAHGARLTHSGKFSKKPSLSISRQQSPFSRPSRDPQGAKPLGKEKNSIKPGGWGKGDFPPCATWCKGRPRRRLPRAIS